MLNEVLNQKYATSICHAIGTVRDLIKAQGGNAIYVDRLQMHLVTIVSEHEYVIPEDYHYWVKGEDLTYLQMESEYDDDDNEKAFDGFLDCASSDGSTFSYDEGDLSEELIKDIETYSERRKSIIRHLIKLIEETPYEQAA